MAIQIGNYNFHGPYSHHPREGCGDLQAQSGVYVALGRAVDGKWHVLDVGESGNVWERVKTHDRTPCWIKHAHREVAIAAIYVPEAQRMLIERELRNQYNPRCGER